MNSITPVTINIKWTPSTGNRVKINFGYFYHVFFTGGTHFKATAEYNTTGGITKLINVAAIKPLATFKG